MKSAGGNQICLRLGYCPRTHWVKINSINSEWIFSFLVFARYFISCCTHLLITVSMKFPSFVKKIKVLQNWFHSIVETYVGISFQAIRSWNQFWSIYHLVLIILLFDCVLIIAWMHLNKSLERKSRENKGARK